MTRKKEKLHKYTIGHTNIYVRAKNKSEAKKKMLKKVQRMPLSRVWSLRDK